MELSFAVGFNMAVHKRMKLSRHFFVCEKGKTWEEKFDFWNYEEMQASLVVLLKVTE